MNKNKLELVEKNLMLIYFFFYLFKQFKQWYKKIKKLLGSARRSFEQTLERAEANTEWMTKYYSVIEAWLEAKITS